MNIQKQYSGNMYTRLMGVADDLKASEVDMVSTNATDGCSKLTMCGWVGGVNVDGGASCPALYEDITWCSPAGQAFEIWRSYAVWIIPQGKKKDS
jgi:uncharacterized protein (DUF983 family)